MMDLNREIVGDRVGPDAQRLAGLILERIVDEEDSTRFPFAETVDLATWASDDLDAKDDPAICDVTLCIAGWAVHLDGWDIVKDTRGHTPSAVKGSTERRLPALAEQLLGLRAMGANHLFYDYDEDEAKLALEIMRDHGVMPYLEDPDGSGVPSVAYYQEPA